MVNATSRAAYSRRAREYIERLGSMTATHPADRHLVSMWASDADEVIDVGCGPGHWTNFLADQGVSVRGIDLVHEFIEHARHAYPATDFTVGSLDSLGVDSGSVSGILSWYSLIHYEPDAILVPLLEFGRALKPGGTLLIGFFQGPTVDKFSHAVLPAYRWPVDDLCDKLIEAKFDVVESHVRKAAGQRPHAAVIARRRHTR